MRSTDLNRFRLSNLIASVVSTFKRPEELTYELNRQVEGMLEGAAPLSDEADGSMFPLQGINYTDGKVSDPDALILSCKNRMMWAEQKIHQDLTLALSIKKFASKHDAVAAREVETLKERALQIAQDTGHEIIDRKVMLQSTRLISADIKFALDGSEASEDIFLSTAVQVNKTGDVAIVYYPHALEETVLSKIADIVDIPEESLKKCVRVCDPGIQGYMFGEDYQYVNPQNITAARYAQSLSMA